MKKNMKQCLMWMRWKMPEKWCTFFPPIPIFICQQLFFVSLLIYFLKSNINWITSSAIYYHQLLLLHISMPIQSRKQKQERNFWKSKNNNCRLKLSLFYPNILSIVIYVTTYYNILTNWNKKNWDQFSAQKLHCLLLFTFITLMVDEDLVSKF